MKIARKMQRNPLRKIDTRCLQGLGLDVEGVDESHLSSMIICAYNKNDLQVFMTYIFNWIKEHGYHDVALVITRGPECIGLKCGVNNNSESPPWDAFYQSDDFYIKGKRTVAHGDISSAIIEMLNPKYLHNDIAVFDLRLINVRQEIDLGKCSEIERFNIEYQKNNIDKMATLIDMKKTSLLFQAARRGNIALVKELVSHRADVNWLNHNKASALYVAAQEGHLEVVKFLHQSGANINECRSLDMYNPLDSPLERALNSQQYQVMVYLLDSGAVYDLNIFMDVLKKRLNVEVINLIQAFIMNDKNQILPKIFHLLNKFKLLNEGTCELVKQNLDIFSHDVFKPLYDPSFDGFYHLSQDRKLNLTTFAEADLRAILYHFRPKPWKPGESEDIRMEFLERFIKYRRDQSSILKSRSLLILGLKILIKHKLDTESNFKEVVASANIKFFVLLISLIDKKNRALTQEDIDRAVLYHDILNAGYEGLAVFKVIYSNVFAENNIDFDEYLNKLWDYLEEVQAGDMTINELVMCIDQTRDPMSDSENEEDEEIEHIPDEFMEFHNSVTRGDIEAVQRYIRERRSTLTNYVLSLILNMINQHPPENAFEIQTIITTLMSENTDQGHDPSQRADEDELKDNSINETKLCEIDPERNIKIPEWFIDNVSGSIMDNPVTLSTGQTYDRSTLQSLKKNNLLKCPNTGIALDEKEFDNQVNITMKNLINEFVESKIAEYKNSNSDQNAPKRSREDQDGNHESSQLLTHSRDVFFTDNTERYHSDLPSEGNEITKKAKPGQ